MSTPLEIVLMIKANMIDNPGRGDMGTSMVIAIAVLDKALGRFLVGHGSRQAMK